jgi:enamine deaminase RidA (YjgF/YER057c/UK114 family)
MTLQRIDPGWAWTKNFNFWIGWKHGNVLQLSGLVAFAPDGKIVGVGDFYAQTIQIFKNIDEALASAGSGLKDVVKFTTYLTDMAGYPDFARARGDTFPDGVPASTTVGTPALIKPELLVEIEAMAIVRD